MRPKLIALFIIVGLGVAAFFIFGSRNQMRSGSFRDYNILLITIDTLRADHLPAYGYTHIKTPNLDQLAAKSFVFDNAIAQIPMTLPSHATILTGLFPYTHGIRDNAGFFLDSKVTTLAEVLKQNGYKTAAFVSAFVLDSQFGLAKGFDLYSDEFTLAEGRVSNTDVFRRAEKTEIEIESWLKQNHNQRFFLWAHYYDPHDPYDPPEPYKTEYASSLYDGEIAYTDHVIGKLFESLKQNGVAEKTIVILTGDHGEGLGEHKERTHSLFIYDATQHVPLMIHLPNKKAHRIQSIVSHIDIAPSILELAGISPASGMQGKSLIPLINGKEDPDRIAYSESIFPELHYGWSPLKGITTTKYKFIEAPKPELYDRSGDRSEQKNIIASKADVADALRKQLQSFIDADTQKSNPQKLDPETEERLGALGYVASTTTPTAESRNTDPKDKVELLEVLTKAGKAMEAGNFQYVLQATAWVEKQDPNIVDAHFLASGAYLHLGQKENALQEMLKTIRLKPDHTQTLYNLALYSQLEGKLEESERWYLQLLKYEPENLFGNLNLAALYLNMKKPEKAQPYVTKVIDSYEKSIRSTAAPETKSNLLEKVAEIYFRTGDLKRSEECVNQAIELTPHRAVLYFHLGNIYRRGNDLNRSVSSFRKAIEMDPKFYQAYYALAETYYVMNTNLEEAIRLIEIANRAEPNQQAEAFLQALRKKLGRP
jgi:choline-sulfatase